MPLVPPQSASLAAGLLPGMHLPFPTTMLDFARWLSGAIEGLGIRTTSPTYRRRQATSLIPGRWEGLGAFLCVNRKKEAKPAIHPAGPVRRRKSRAGIASAPSRQASAWPPDSRHTHKQCPRLQQPGPGSSACPSSAASRSACASSRSAICPSGPTDDRFRSCAVISWSRASLADALTRIDDWHYGNRWGMLLYFPYSRRPLGWPGAHSCA